MISPLAVSLALIAFSPLAMLVLHIVVHRALMMSGRPVTGHGSAMRAIALTFFIVLAGVAWLGVLAPSRGFGEAVATVLYVGMTYGAMSLLYINVINIAETSLTMHTMLEIWWAGAGNLSGYALYAKYDADHMVRVRMDRLVSLGQIRTEGDRYVLAAHWLLRFAQAVDLWRKAIGVPSPAILSQQPRT